MKILEGGFAGQTKAASRPFTLSYCFCGASRGRAASDLLPPPPPSPPNSPQVALAGLLRVGEALLLQCPAARLLSECESSCILCEPELLDCGNLSGGGSATSEPTQQGKKSLRVPGRASPPPLLICSRKCLCSPAHGDCFPSPPLIVLLCGLIREQRGGLLSEVP